MWTETKIHKVDLLNFLNENKIKHFYVVEDDWYKMHLIFYKEDE